MNRLIALLVAALFGFGQPAIAQQLSSSQGIATIDTTVIMEKAVAAKDARAQIDKLRADLFRSVTAHQEEVNKLNQTISQERAGMTEEVFQQRMRDILQKNAENQRLVQERQAAIDAASRDAAKRIEISVGEIVDEFRKERSYGIVIVRSAIMGTTSAPDITEDVIGRLDRRLPHVDVLIK